jgi:hypothetical protein
MKELASRNEAGWEGLCYQLWSTKVHVQKPPPLALLDSSDSGGTPPQQDYYYMKAYQSSLEDARDRQEITPDELCYDPETRTGTVWSFRFKESAGVDWTVSDPWWYVAAATLLYLNYCDEGFLFHTVFCL